MYLNHFGLTEPPFGITPDTAFALSTRSHQEAFNTLLVALHNGEGFVKVVGEVGTGKTLLCRRLLVTLDPERYVTAYIPNPLLDPQTLLRVVAEELGVPAEGIGDAHHLFKRLNGALLEFAARDLTVVLFVDEAQALPLESLEALRLLSNLETEKRKLLQVVLFGQPELDVKLADHAVRQLRQRIAFACRLQGLGLDEVDMYLAHRLTVAGYGGGGLFCPAAVRRLHRAAGGVPRLINILANKSLLLVFGEGGYRVKPRHIAAAARDSAQGAGGRIAWTWWLGGAIAASLAGLGVLAGR
jgi:MSHA biogenesis protein MshM